jgi:acyl-coenzyme A thioesterase PaaI-like protein
MRMPSARALRRILNLWPPFLFAGIRVLELSDDMRRARVVLKRHWYNRNFVGTHFGGSLFAMTDPFWMVMTLYRLGDGYIVWDKSAEIEFVEATRAPVFAEFVLDDATIEAIRAATEGGEKCLRWFETEVRTTEGQVVARVRKELYVRRKRRD